jgi:hypothetical protein
MKTTFGVATVVATFALSLASQAASVIGAVNFSASGENGGVVLQDSLGIATTNLGLAAGIQSWQSPKVDSSSGSFTMVPNGQVVSFSQPWVFEPSTPMAPLWTIVGFGDFTFTLSSSTVVFRNSKFLLVAGDGVLTGTNFDPTPGTWFFSTQGVAAEGKFSWSSATDAVPETGTPMILSAAVLCVCFLRRRG